MTSTAGLSVSEAGRVFVDPSAYADEERFHEATTLLRRESPVHWVDEPDYRPFWAITRHADVMDVERDNARFLERAATAAGDRGGRGARRGEGPGAAHAHPHGRAGPQGVPRRGGGLVPTQGAQADGRPDARAGDPLRRPHGGAGDRMRLRPRHRRALSALRDLVAARPARERLRPHADAHPTALRRRRRGAAALDRPRGAVHGAARLLQLLHRADRVPSGHADRGPGVGAGQRADRRRVPAGHGPGVVLRDHRDGGPRHDELDHRRRPARVAAPPRRTGPPAGGPRTAHDGASRR